MLHWLFRIKAKITPWSLTSCQLRHVFASVAVKTCTLWNTSGSWMNIECNEISVSVVISKQWKETHMFQRQKYSYQLFNFANIRNNKIIVDGLPHNNNVTMWIESNRDIVLSVQTCVSSDIITISLMKNISFISTVESKLRTWDDPDFNVYWKGCQNFCRVHFWYWSSFLTGGAVFTSLFYIFCVNEGNEKINPISCFSVMLNFISAAL